MRDRSFIAVRALLAALLCLALVGPVFARSNRSGPVRVRGYYRKDGTYVRPHYRSRPDGIFSNNWSTKGNVNPYTGAVGTKTEPSGSGVNQSAPTGYEEAGEQRSKPVGALNLRPPLGKGARGTVIPSPKPTATKATTGSAIPVIGTHRVTGPVTAVSVTAKSAAEPAKGSDLVEKLTLSIATLCREGKYQEALAATGDLRKAIQQRQRVSTPAPNQTSAATKQKSPLALLSQGRRLEVHFGTNLIYRLADNPEMGDLSSGKGWPVGTIYIAEDGKRIIQNRYLKIGDQTHEVRFSSSNPEVVMVDDKGTVSAKKAGRAVVTFQFGDEAVRIYYLVVMVPVHFGISQDQIIEKIGLPDRRTKTYVAAFEHDSLDGISYYGGTDGNTVEHWHYDQFPGAMLFFYDSEWLMSLQQLEWEQNRSLRFSLD